MLSVCIIAKNEEEVLEACLQSVIPVADEIILLDTGSTDNTVAIAKRYGCNIYHYEWDGNFTRARNTACSYARHDWILCLDCDERLHNPAEVANAIGLATAHTGCIITERHNHAVAKDGERSNEMRGNARLFRNVPEVRWAFGVHEETWSSCISNGMALQHSNIVLDHEVWRPGATGFLEKQTYYDGLLTRYILEKPVQHYIFHSAKTRMLFEDYATAITIFEQAEKAEGYQVHNDAFIKCYKGYCYLQLKEYAKAEEHLLLAQELVPGLSAAHLYLHGLYLRLGQYDKALDCADRLVRTGAAWKPLTVADMYFTDVQVNYRKANVLLQTGDVQGAKDLLLHDGYDYDSARPLVLLARIAFIEGNKQEAGRWIAEALQCNPGWQHLYQLQKTFA